VGASDPFSFSTLTLPRRERVGYWREVLSRQYFRLDSEATPGAPFHADIRVTDYGGVGVGVGAQAGLRDQRTRELISDGNASFGLTLNLQSRFFIAHRGRESMLHPGEAFLMSAAEPGMYVRQERGRLVGVRLPRAFLAERVPHADDVLGERIPSDNGALVLLRRYLRLLDRLQLPHAVLGPGIGGHLADLVALALGASRDIAQAAFAGGVRAARLDLIKADIRDRVHRRKLSVGDVAARHGVGERYVQKLFEEEGTTFSRFVLGERLAGAYRDLADPGLAGIRISDIVFDNGFPDVSRFNREFRRMFGATPSEVRTARRRL
jgi:AraC-like DNA-binding protein